MDDRDLCWLALNLVFYGPSAAARRVLGRFASVGDIFRAARADFDGLRLDAGGRRGHRVGAGRRPGRAGIGKNRTEGVYSFDP